MHHLALWSHLVKKILFMLAMISVATTAVAQYTGPLAHQASNVQQLRKNGTDDQYVTLKGHLITRLSHDKYTFDDGSAQMRVEIPNRLFPLGVPISPSTLVQITGTYDKERFGTSEIEVKHLLVM